MRAEQQDEMEMGDGMELTKPTLEQSLDAIDDVYMDRLPGEGESSLHVEAQVFWGLRSAPPACTRRASLATAATAVGLSFCSFARFILHAPAVSSLCSSHYKHGPRLYFPAHVGCRKRLSAL